VLINGQQDQIQHHPAQTRFMAPLAAIDRLLRAQSCAIFFT
jgi:hypothetical protein